MIYKHFHDLSLSALGLGCMRLPTVEGDNSRIDEAASAQMLRYAMEQGINYYDTAWGYHSGNSETVMGKLLQAYPRESYYLASKFPGFSKENMEKKEEIFERQLEKCQTDYFDFYLFHCVCESNIEDYTDPQYDLMGYLLEQKKKGRIRHLGFSAHCSLETMKRFLDAHGEHLEFGQLQLNWLDWTFQRAEEKVAMLREYGLPVWVMEPVRGGMLASLSESRTETLRALRPEEGTPAWAFRFLQTLPEVTMVLSGMSNMQQLSDNIRTFETEKPLNDEEWAALQGIAGEMLERMPLPCTSCRYCTAKCPQMLDIPAILTQYNQCFFGEEGAGAPALPEELAGDKGPASCLHCRRCEAACPQQIRISEAMGRFAEVLHA